MASTPYPMRVWHQLTSERAWKTLRIVLLVFAILAQMPRELFGRTPSSDEYMQIAGAQSLRQGQGYTSLLADPNDFAHAIRSPITGWPPAFSVLTALLMLFISRTWLVLDIINVLSVIIFFTSWLVILELLGKSISIPAKIGVLLFWGLAFSPLWWTYANSMAIAVFSLALALAIMSLKATRFQVALAIGSGLLVGLSTTVRYAYWPLVVVIPVIFFYFALRHNRRFIRLAVVNTLAAGVVFGALVVWSIVIEGAVAFFGSGTTPGAAGFWLDQLKATPPVAVAPLGLMDIMGINGRKHFFSPEVFTALTWILCLFLLGVFLAQIYISLRTPREASLAADWRYREIFFVAGGLIFAIVMSMLFYLTLRYKDQTFFITNIRYYVPFFPFLLTAYMMGVFPTTPTRLSFNPGQLARLGLALILLGFIILGPYAKIHIMDSHPFQFPADTAIAYGNDPVRQTILALEQQGKQVVFMTGEDSAVYILKSDSLAAGADVAVFQPAQTSYPTSVAITLVLAIPHPQVSTPEETETMTHLCLSYNCTDLQDTSLYHLYQVDLAANIK